MTIASERLLPREFPGGRLRRLRAADLAAFQAYRNLPELGLFQGWEPMSEESALAFLAEANGARLFVPGDWVQIGIAEVGTDVLIGDIGLHVSDDGLVGEIGYTLALGSQGRGIATAAVREAVRMLFVGTAIRVVRGITDSRNLPSIRLLERVGFRHRKERLVDFRGEDCFEKVYELRRSDGQWNSVEVQIAQADSHGADDLGDPFGNRVSQSPSVESVLAELGRLGFDVPSGVVRLGCYGDSPEQSESLLALIRSGRKRAGTSLLWGLQTEGESLPEPGQFEVVLDYWNRPVLACRIVRVDVLPFDAVTAAYAAIEGEGDGSLRSWRTGHWRFFSRECRRIGRVAVEDMPVVCTVFEVLGMVPSTSMRDPDRLESGPATTNEPASGIPCETD